METILLVDDEPDILAIAREMLEGERNRPDRVDLVTIATPNSTHYEITKAFLQAGFGCQGVDLRFGWTSHAPIIRPATRTAPRAPTAG